MNITKTILATVVAGTLMGSAAFAAPRASVKVGSKTAHSHSKYAPMKKQKKSFRKGSLAKRSKRLIPIKPGQKLLTQR